MTTQQNIDALTYAARMAIKANNFEGFNLLVLRIKAAKSKLEKETKK